MARPENTSPADFLRALIPEAEVRAEARRLGVVKRVRKIDVVALLYATVVTVCGRDGQSFADMRRGFVFRGGPRVARSAFWRRFTPAFNELIKWLLARLQDRARAHKPVMNGVLTGFRDVVAVDATVVKVHDSLKDRWAGTRKSRVAAIKVHTWVRALTGELLKHRITRERFGDSKAMGVTWSDAGTLFLFDRGYAAASLWYRIDRVGAYFLVPLPASFWPAVCSENRAHRGRARKLLYADLQTAATTLKRKIIDVNCAFRAHVRPHGKPRGRYEWPQFRVVGIRKKTGSGYRFYVTNASVEQLPAEKVAALYRLRWEVETFYKTGKSGLGLKEFHTRKKHRVETLVRATLIRASIAMQSRRRARATLGRLARVNPNQWVRVWRWAAEELSRRLLRNTRAPLPTWRELAELASDPNVGRPTVRWLFTVGVGVGAAHAA